MYIVCSFLTPGNRYGESLFSWKVGIFSMITAFEMTMSGLQRVGNGVQFGLPSCPSLTRDSKHSFTLYAITCGRQAVNIKGKKMWSRCAPCCDCPGQSGLDSSLEGEDERAELWPQFLGISQWPCLERMVSKASVFSKQAASGRYSLSLQPSWTDCTFTV